MKRLSSIFLSLFFLMCSIKHVRAADLTVTCNSTSCPFSSNQPLFPATTIWVPGKAETKTIELINTVNTSKELSFTIKPTQNSSISQFIYLDFKNESGGIIWSGTLEELYLQETLTLITLNGIDSTIINIAATLMEGSPNAIQGDTTTFDFSISSKASSGGQGNNHGNQNNNQDNNGNQKNQDKSSSGNNNNGNTTDSNTNTNSTETTDLEDSSILLPNVAGISENIFFQQLTQVESDIEIPDNLQEITGSPSAVLGLTKQEGECENKPFWWIILLLQTLLLSLLQRIKHFKVKLFLKSIISMVTGLILFYLVCNSLLILTTVIPLIIIQDQALLRKHLSKYSKVTS